MDAVQLATFQAVIDEGSFDGQHLVFTDDGALPGAPEHHYVALVGTASKPDSGMIGDQFWGPQPGHRCTGTEPGAPADPKPSAEAVADLDHAGSLVIAVDVVAPDRGFDLVEVL